MRSGIFLVWTTLAFARLAMPQTAFIETARAATEKYKDRLVAIADGYRKIGTDFPAMGEHWINIGLLFDGKFEAAHPEVLTYVTVSGKPQLLGVAYILPLLPGESPPDAPVAKEKWHDHFRTIEDETELPRHDHAMSMDNDQPRMAMLHAWIWLENPNGAFAPDNWAVPWFRSGIKPPANSPDTAGKALSLAVGGTEYFSASISASVRLTRSEQEKIDAAFDRAHAAVETLRERAEVESLSAVWARLWKEIDASVDPKNRPALQQLPVR